MVMLEALAVSILGAFFGALGAITLSKLLTMVPTFRAVVDGRIAPVTIAEGLLVACLVAALGSIYPAYRATRQIPVDALRYA
jgi:ABC-type antimicrobial peptide transport system permease subunit